MLVPTTVLRAGLRGSRPLFGSPRVPLPVKRRLVDVISGTSGRPRGTSAVAMRVAGVPVVRVVVPQSVPGVSVLCLHGGGFALGSASAYAGFAARVAVATGADAIVPDYRRSPEHPYPAALDDVEAVYRAMLDGGQDPARLVVVGDSAGGGLALALALRLRDARVPLPAVLGLVCPWLDLACDAEGRRGSTGDPLIVPEMIGSWVRPYVGARDPWDPGISPVHGDLLGLPPIVVHSAGDDPLRADAELLEERVQELGPGGAIEHRVWVGQWHDFHLQAGRLRGAQEAVDALGLALRGSLPDDPIEHVSKYPLDTATMPV